MKLLLSRVAAIFVAGMIVFSFPARPAPADERTAGVIRRSEGATFVARAGTDIPGREGFTLQESDVLRTGHDGRLGVILRDDTRLSLGPDTEIKIEQFVFVPSRSAFGLVLRMARGAAVYVSGKIAVLSPKSARFETPVATLSTRGTTFGVIVRPD